MHIAIHLLGFWAATFVTLCAAVALLDIFYNLINFDFALHSLGKEIVLAAIASFIEGASLWAVFTLLPAAARALIIPALIVGVIYKVSHLEDWNRYDIAALLCFQFFIGCFGATLLLGHFRMAIIILVIFAAILSLIAVIAKSFD